MSTLKIKLALPLFRAYEFLFCRFPFFLCFLYIRTLESAVENLKQEIH